MDATALNPPVAPANDPPEPPGAPRDSEMEFRAFFEVASVGLIQVDPRNGRILRNNQKFSDITGYSADELAGIAFSTLTHPDDRLKDWELFSRAARGETPDYRNEKRYVRKDGSTVWVRINASFIRGPDGRPYRTAAICEDISESKRVEAALRQSEELLQRIGAIAKIGAWELDLRTQKPHWSLETFRIHEIEPFVDLPYDEAIQFYPPEARSLVESAIRCARENGTAWDLEVPLISAKGRTLWVRVLGSVLTENGIPVKLRGAIQDITAQKLVEADKDRLAELNLHHQKSESLSRMAGAVAHHFNNQLQAVMGNIELVVSDLPPGSDTARGLFAAMGAARKAAEMSGLMLTYLGQQRAAVETVDLCDVAEEALRRLKDGQPPHIVVESVLPAPGPAIRANSMEIQGIISKLMINAWEAIGPKKGVVRVAIQTVTADQISSGTRAPVGWEPSDPEYARLEVSDTGVGIKSDVIEQIFDPFYSTKFLGRGLGLSIVLGTVRSLHGVITVASNPGRGTVFRIYLPLSLSTPRPRSVTSATPSQPPRRATILVVENEPEVRVFTTLALSQSGHTVLAASNGAEAVTLFRQSADAVDCVVCDVTMPGMSGWETLSALRQLKPGIPVILVSGHREEQVMAESNAERPQCFLQKPYGKQALYEAVQKVLT